MSLAPSVRIRRRTDGQRRYLPRALAAAADLAAFARLPEDEARVALAARLRSLQTSLFRSPYYVERLRSLGLSPFDLRSLDDLPHFPTLDRDTLRARFADLPAFDPDGPEAREIVAVRTSGSTGQPVTVLKDSGDCLHMWAVLRFWTAWLGLALPPRPRVVLLCSLSNGLEYSVRLPILDDGALHRISVLRARALDRLLRARPAVVFSDPAGLHWLAGQEARPQPALLLTSAQHFSTRQREELARAVPAPVINYYACADAGPLAWECLAHPGRLHALLPDAWLESVGGEIAVTRLRPGVMPLLRYRTGDRGDVVRDDCACGYRGWSVVGFAGRRECAFLRPDGRRADAWQLVWLFKHYPLAAFRLTQTGREDFELELVGDGADLADLERRLRASLALLGWSDARITVRAVPALEARGGKPEPFRCALAA